MYGARNIVCTLQQCGMSLTVEQSVPFSKVNDINPQATVGHVLGCGKSAGWHATCQGLGHTRHHAVSDVTMLKHIYHKYT